MGRLSNLLSTHWFVFSLFAAGLLAAGFSLFRQQRTGRHSFSLLLLASTLGLLGVGGLAVSDFWGLCVASVAVGALLLTFVVMLLSGKWWPPLAWTLAALCVIGLGGAITSTASEMLTDAYGSLRTLEPRQEWAAKGFSAAEYVLEQWVRPAWLSSSLLSLFHLLWWLPLLLAIGVTIWFVSRRSLAGLGTVRSWSAIVLRTSLLFLLVLAILDTGSKRKMDAMTVLFVFDRSYSIPEELEPDPKSTIDRRQERIRRFINESVEIHGRHHTQDRAGLIVFGRQPKLELQPISTPRFNLKDIASQIDGNYTDIGAAIKLALASFPPDTGKRIVLLSDGNENLGNMEEQARLARLNNVQIDVVPLAAGQRNQNEVLVESVSAPAQIEKGADLAVTVRIRSFNPNIVKGQLLLIRVTKDYETGVMKEESVKGSPKEVDLEPGLNSITFRDSVTDQDQSYSYEARFTPKGYFDGERFVEGLPGSKPQNKIASTHVIARGERRILLVEATKDEHRFLYDQLLAAGRSKFKVTRIVIDQLPQNKDTLGVYLSTFDSVIFANVPAEAMSEDQMEMIRSNTHDQGCGLVVIGGPDSYGAGGWQGTAIEKALPVDADIKSLQVQGKGGLVLIMHASEMAKGNFWQKKIAKLAIEKLSPADEVGMLYFDWGITKWHIPLQQIKDQKAKLMAQVDKMSPGDMPDFDPSLKMAYDALRDPKRDLSTKHIILISDGDPISNMALLPAMRDEKITVTTVGIATHGANEDNKMAAIAKATGGRYYGPRTNPGTSNPAQLPAIYIKETRLVSQAFLYEKKFPPNLLFSTGPTEELPKPLPPLYGFVRTTPKQNPLVEIPIETPPIGEQKFPILAYWHYGLGKAVAFTSDARTQPGKKFWDRDWAEWNMYSKFWEQVIDWSLRPVESKRLTMTAETHDGKVKIVVEARDDQNKPITNLNLRGGVTIPGGGGGVGKQEVIFHQTNSGTYEGEIKADAAGAYFITAQATRKAKILNKDGKEEWIDEGFDSVRAGVTIPYSQEFAVMESNQPLLERIREITDGKSYADADDALIKAAESGDVFRKGIAPSDVFQPLWHWLLLLSGVVLFCDVAVRRIALEPERVLGPVRRWWDRQRGREMAREQAPQFLDRLKTRKAQVLEALEKPKATRRFEGTDAPVYAPPGATDEPAKIDRPLPKAPAERPGMAPDSEKQDAGDFGSRLLRAKKRVWQEKDKDKET
jgi:uncharacterized membrane protein